MTHYICTGECGGISDKPGVCNMESCSKHNQPLEECNCDSPEHIEKLQKQISFEDNED